MPHTLKDPVRHKFTKKSYNVRDWSKYDEGLKNRGSLTVWFSEDAVAAWNHVKSDKMKRGGQRVYSDLAIETAHTLRLVYKQPLRQTEGLLTSIVQLLDGAVAQKKMKTHLSSFYLKLYATRLPLGIPRTRILFKIRTPICTSVFWLSVSLDLNLPPIIVL
jgi:hypothetical protein